MTTSFSGTKLTMEGSVYSGINLGQKNQNQWTQILWPLLNWSPGSQEIKCLIVQNFRPCFLFLKWNEIVTKSFPVFEMKWNCNKVFSHASLKKSQILVFCLPHQLTPPKTPLRKGPIQLFTLSNVQTFILWDFQTFTLWDFHTFRLPPDKVWKPDIVLFNKWVSFFNFSFHIIESVVTVATCDKTV